MAAFRRTSNPLTGEVTLTSQPCAVLKKNSCLLYTQKVPKPGATSGVTGAVAGISSTCSIKSYEL